MSLTRASLPADTFPGDRLVRRTLLPVLRHLDYALLALMLCMAGVGLVVLSGALHGVPVLDRGVERQTIFLAVAAVALVATTFIDYRWINRMALTIYGFNLLALLFVLVVGSRINGAKSWIDVGPINWQPSETMKIATVLVCGQWLSLRPEEKNSWRGFFVPGVLCGLPAAFVLLQPDLGTASLFFVIYLTMMLVAGFSKQRAALILLAAAIGAVCAFPFLKPYQQARLTSFVNPAADPSGAGYNLIQSRIAIGSGGFWGKGWAEGTQSNHRFLPEHHTDFIFSSAVEQFGFVGGCLILMGFFLLMLRMLRAMDLARDRFGGIVVAGLLALFAGHLVLNVGMTMGLLPITGIPLPFFSYGGSFLVTTFVLFGLVLNVSSRRYTFIGL